MHSKALWTGLFVGSIVLSGCSASSSLLESKRVDYKSAAKVPTLEVPPDLTAPSADDRYAMPDSKSAGAATFSNYSKDRAAAPQVNAASAVLPAGDKVKLERSGAERWLVVRMAPEDLWPQLKIFWQEQGFVLKSENSQTGLMETDWAENRAKIPQDFIRRAVGKVFDDLYATAERDKFRTRLERGKEPGTSEIFISHRGMEEVVSDTRNGGTRWQPRATDPELEAEFLHRLMVRLGVEESQAVAQAAQATTENAKIRKGSDGASTLALNDAFDRAWRRVGLALDRVGFTVEDRDRSKGLYFVRYADSDTIASKSGGFLSKLAFWRSDAKASTQQYRIQVSEAGQNTDVKVLDKSGVSTASDTATRIIALLYQELK